MATTVHVASRRAEGHMTAMPSPHAPLHVALAIWRVRDHVRHGASMSQEPTTTAPHAIRATHNEADLAGAMSVMVTLATDTTAVPGQPTPRVANVAAMTADTTSTTALRDPVVAIPGHPIRAASEACAAAARPLAKRGEATHATHALASVAALQLTPTDACDVPLSLYLVGAVGCGAMMRSLPVG